MHIAMCIDKQPMNTEFSSIFSGLVVGQYAFHSGKNSIFLGIGITVN